MPDIFLGIVEKLVPTSIVRLEGVSRSLIGFVCYDRPEQNELIVHEVSHMAEIAKGDVLPISGGELIVQNNYKEIISAELVYPYECKLELKKLGNAVKIQLPALDIHQIVRLRYEEQ